MVELLQRSVNGDKEAQMELANILGEPLKMQPYKPSPTYAVKNGNNVIIRHNGDLIYNGVLDEMSDEVKTIYDSLEDVTLEDVCKML